MAGPGDLIASQTEEPESAKTRNLSFLLQSTRLGNNEIQIAMGPIVCLDMFGSIWKIEISANMSKHGKCLVINCRGIKDILHSIVLVECLFAEEIVGGVLRGRPRKIANISIRARQIKFVNSL